MKRSNRNNCRNSSVRSERGFSVVELLIVVVVIGILAAIALPGGMRQLQLHRLDSSVSIISNKIMEARMDAIKRNRTSRVTLDLAGRSAQVKSTDNANTSIDVGYAKPFTDGVVLNSGSSVDISFDSLGRLASPGTQVTVTLRERNSGRRKNIVISPAGKVTVGPMY